MMTDMSDLPIGEMYSYKERIINGEPMLVPVANSFKVTWFEEGEPSQFVDDMGVSWYVTTDGSGNKCRLRATGGVK